MHVNEAGELAKVFISKGNTVFVLKYQYESSLFTEPFFLLKKPEIYLSYFTEVCIT